MINVEVRVIKDLKPKITNMARKTINNYRKTIKIN